jgi:hypothetical protein
VTATGVVLLVDPLPKFPFPHAHAWPEESSAKLHSSPAEIAVNVTPGGIDAATGVELFAVVPFPSSPWSLSPHPQAWPLESKARLKLSPPARAMKLTP